MGSPNSAAALRRLSAAVGSANVLTAHEDVMPFVTDWKGSSKGVPFCVVRPGSTAEVAAVVTIVREEGLSLVPQGGNTGLAAGATPDESARQVVLLLSRMNRVRAVDPVGLTIEVEAGCVLQAAQDAARDAGRLLPVSLAAEGTAQVGGIIATNAGGLNVLRYGMTRAFVLGLEIVLADGTIVDGMRRLRKDNAGFDWKQLFIGCEGTLGIITGAILRLVPQSRHRATSLIAVDDPMQAVALLAHAQDSLGDVITSFELMSQASLDLVREHFADSPPFASPWYVLIEASASLPGLDDAFEAMLADALENEIALDAVIAQSEDQSARLWRLRELITEAEHKAGGTVKHDVSIPIDRIPAFISDATNALALSNPDAALSIFGHLGDGNLHFNILPGASDRAVITRTTHDLVAAYDGSISAEHGIGTFRIADLKHYKRSGEIELAVAIKRALDPLNIMNPGKVLSVADVARPC
jgi:FAD/FMN-containing dehydrogenase